MNPETKHLWNEALGKTLDLVILSTRLATQIGRDVLGRISQESLDTSHFDTTTQLHQEVDTEKNIGELPRFPDEIGELKSLPFNYRGEQMLVNRENTRVVIIRDKPEQAHLIMDGALFGLEDEDMYLFGDLTNILDHLNNVGIEFDLRNSLDDKAMREYDNWNLRQILGQNSPQ